MFSAHRRLEQCDQRPANRVRNNEEKFDEKEEDKNN